MANELQPASPSRRTRILGMTAQTAGVVGIVVCIALVVGVLFARGWAIDRVNEISAKVDDGLARGVPLIETASDRVSEVSGRVSVVADAVDAWAANPGQGLGLVQALLERSTEVSDRYLELRATYSDAREKVVAVLDTLNTLDRLVPGLTVPEGPVDALTALDERVQELDAAVMGLINALPSGDGADVAAGIADKVGRVDAALESASAGLDDAATKLTALRVEVASWTDTVNTVITILAIVLVLGFVYSAVLHWVLYRSGKQMRRDGDVA